VATEHAAESIVRGWEQAWKKAVDEMKFEHITVRYVSSYSFEDAITAASESQLPLLIGGYILVFGWVTGYSYISYSASGSGGVGALTGLAAVLAIVLTTWAAMGVNGILCSAGLRWNPLSFQIVPFLALGLGINDFFVIEQKVHLARERCASSSVVVIMGEAMAMGGTSVTLSSIANAFAFFLGAISPIPAVANFSIQVAVTVVCNYLLALTLFPVILTKSISALRPTSYNVELEKGEKGILGLQFRKRQGQICVTQISEGGIGEASGVISVGDQLVRIDDWQVSGAKLLQVQSTLQAASGTLSLGFSIGKSSSTTSDSDAELECGPVDHDEPSSKVCGCMRGVLNSHVLRSVLLLLNTGLVIFCAYGAKELELGLSWTDVLSSGNPLYDYARVAEADFNSASVYVTYNLGCKEIAPDATGNKQYDCSNTRLNMDDPKVVEGMRRVEDDYIFKGYSSCSAKIAGRSVIAGDNDRAECSGMDTHYGQTSFLRYYTQFVEGNVKSQTAGFDASTDVYWYYDAWEARADLCAGQDLDAPACQSSCASSANQAPSGVKEHSNSRTATCQFLSADALWELWDTGNTKAKEQYGAASYAQLQADHPTRVPVVEDDAQQATDVSGISAKIVKRITFNSH
jgi:hypothetical protein